MFHRFKILQSSFLSVAMIGSCFVMASCMTSEQKQVSDTESVTGATIKPGAAIVMNYEAPQNLGVSQYGVLKLNFSDSYDAGTLKLEARPGEGLRFVSEVAEKEVSLAGNNDHEWELDVTSSKDGIYYISIFALAVLPDGSEMSRAFSARVDVGDISKADASRPNKTNGTLSSDGKTVILDAEEIIR